MKKTLNELNQLRSLPLPAKINLTKNRIRQWYEYWKGDVFVAFSGGLDSTVLLDIVRSIYPDVPALFVNTTIENKHIVDFVKTIDNVEVVVPKMSFKDVCQNKGFPVASKKVARFIRDLQNPTDKNNATRNLRLTGLNRKGDFCPSQKIPKKWLKMVDSPFKISEQCCDILKKEPFKRYEKRTGLKGMDGSRAGESNLRGKHYLQYGCNMYDTKSPRSRPLSVWTNQDVLRYIWNTQIPYSKAYGHIFEDENGRLWNDGEKRTGCELCLFGIHLEKEPNRIQRLKHRDHKKWQYGMYDIGMSKLLDYIEVEWR